MIWVYLGRTLSLDHTFKVANKATIVTPERDHIKVMKGGLLNIINEESEVICWVRAPSKSITETVDLPNFSDSVNPSHRQRLRKL